MLTVSIPKLLQEAHAIKEALEQMGGKRACGNFSGGDGGQDCRAGKYHQRAGQSERPEDAVSQQ